MQRDRRSPMARVLVTAGALLLSATAFAQSAPAELLGRMSAAVKSTSYEGTVIRIRNGKAESLKVVHTIVDGVVHEKVVAQEGNGLEIIRRGNEVHCVLPDKRSVLVEEWDDQSTLFSTLPSSEVRFGSEYDVLIKSKGRVAGREAIELAIKPHDVYRYGHRLWLDAETNFPLKTQLIDENGESIELVKFADITMSQNIDASAVASSYSLEHFNWLQQPSGHSGRSVETDWISDDLPQGFRAVMTHEESLESTTEPVTHIVFSDGLASVSIFIVPESGKGAAKPAKFGGSNSFSVVRDGFEITAIGEVPAATVEQFATTMYLP